jgi:hypothetical protein
MDEWPFAYGEEITLMLQPSLNSGAAHPMRPLRPLYVVLFIAQVTGAAGGLWLARHPSWFENVWAGAALLTLPGYLAGWAVQKKMAPAALAAHGNTVRRIGVAAAMLSIAVFFMPFGQ